MIPKNTKSYCSMEAPAINKVIVGSRSDTLVPCVTLRPVAELHVGSGRPLWKMFVTSCYF